MAEAQPGVLEAILQWPPPSAKQKAHKYPLDCGRVLTSEQCIQEMEKAEEKKHAEKEDRAKEREKKRRLSRRRQESKKGN